METLQTQVLGADCAQEIVLRMTPNELPRLEITSDGVTRYKTVNLTGLLTMLDQSVVVEKLKEEERYRIAIPPLPKDTLLVSTDETPKELKIEVTGWIPKTVYPLIYGDVAYTVEIPTVVYKAVWVAQTNQLDRLSIAVTTDETAHFDSPLFRWPFSNVYDSGRVCWSVHKVSCELEEVVEKGVFAFIQTPNNRDLFGVGHSQNSSHRDYGEFLSAIQDDGNIPVEWLIPLNQTAREFHAR